MEQIRLIMLVESRIRGDVYVRFGGEYQKTYHSNMIRRWVLSLPWETLLLISHSDITTVQTPAFLKARCKP